MGKRSDFKRRKQDRYFTPPEAVAPLLPHLSGPWEAPAYYIEPCYGEGHLVNALGSFNPEGIRCWSHSDVEVDARTTDYSEMTPYAEYFITNPPWTREILHPIIENLSSQLPTWLLFDAPWMHTKQAIPYLKKCRKIVSVGRVSWMQNGTSSLDDCCWYLFDKDEYETVFYERES